jgi:hypothetical protein
LAAGLFSSPGEPGAAEAGAKEQGFAANVISVWLEILSRRR